MSEILFRDESYRIMGACFEVYREKGCGFLEDVYQECLELEFAAQDIPAISQPELQLEYKGTILRKKYKPDFVCYNKIIIELKSVKTLDDSHRAQLHNYLRATGYKLGLLINFGTYPKIQYERIALSY